MGSREGEVVFENPRSSWGFRRWMWRIHQCRWWVFHFLFRLNRGRPGEPGLLDLSANIGVLNDWKWPDIKGLKDFKGTLCHTARWPKNLDLKDKTIAVLGSGSSGIQVIAHVQPEVKKMYHWIREWFYHLKEKLNRLMSSGIDLFRLQDLDLSGFRSAVCRSWGEKL